MIEISSLQYQSLGLGDHRWNTRGRKCNPENYVCGTREYCSAVVRWPLVHSSRYGTLGNVGEEQGPVFFGGRITRKQSEDREYRTFLSRLDPIINWVAKIKLCTLLLLLVFNSVMNFEYIWSSVEQLLITEAQYSLHT